VGIHDEHEQRWADSGQQDWGGPMQIGNALHIQRWVTPRQVDSLARKFTFCFCLLGPVEGLWERVAWCLVIDAKVSSKFELLAPCHARSNQFKEFVVTELGKANQYQGQTLLVWLEPSILSIRTMQLLKLWTGERDSPVNTV